MYAPGVRGSLFLFSPVFPVLICGSNPASTAHIPKVESNIGIRKFLPAYQEDPLLNVLSKSACGACHSDLNQ